jgi:hypothetical protein
LIVSNHQETYFGESTSVAFKSVSQKKAVTTIEMTSRSRPVAAKLGIKSLNLKTKWPNVLKVIPSSGAVAAIPEKKIVSSLPTAIENGTGYLIPTHQLAELQQKFQQQFLGFRGTVTIISIKLNTS